VNGRDVIHETYSDGISGSFYSSAEDLTAFELCNVDEATVFVKLFLVSVLRPFNS
jgi:hypothetical protein